jgi:hypothetical protein
MTQADAQDKTYRFVWVSHNEHVNEIARQPRARGLLVICITHDIFQVPGSPIGS